MTGSANVVSVASGAGNVAMKPGATTTAELADIVVLDADLHATMTSPQFGNSASSPYSTLVIRRNMARAYLCTTRVNTSSEITMTVSRGDDAPDAIQAKPTGITMKANEQFHTRFVVTGANPSRLRCRVWKSPNPEPTSWLIDLTDATAELQGAASVGMRFYLSQSSTLDTLLLVDDFVARNPIF